MAAVIFRHIPPCDPALIEAAGTIGVSDLHEALGIVAGRMALMEPRIGALNRGLRIAGQAVTAFLYPGDALLGHCAIALLQPGQVLVSANGNCGPSTMFAELVARAALRNGARGAVVDGSIRDTDALTAMRFPVWSSGISSAHTEKRGPGAVNVPIVCGGVYVEPGDVIVADGDGVISIPLARLAATIEAARERAAREAKIRAAIDAGESLFELMRLGEQIAAAGIEERDEAWSPGALW